jgi:hypothetical protein
MTLRKTCAPNAIAHPINAAVVSLEPSFGSTEAEWLTVDGNAFTLTPFESAREVASEMAAKYERVAAGMRAFAGEPGVCEHPKNRWPWPCADSASAIMGLGPAADAWHARMRHLSHDVCAHTPRLVQP